MHIKKYRINSYSIIFKGNTIDFKLNTNERGSSVNIIYQENCVLFIHGLDVNEVLDVIDFRFICNKRAFSNFIENYSNINSAFLFDKNKKELYVASDRMGVQPIFLHGNMERIIFSPQIIHIHKDLKEPLKINDEGLINFLGFGYCAPETTFIYDNIGRISPSTISIYNSKLQNTDIYKYGKQLRINNSEEEINIDKICDILEESLVKIEKPFVGVTSGKDSLVISSLYSSEINNISSGNFGTKSCNDVVFGKILAEKMNFKYKFSDLCSLDELDKYINQIAFFSSGMATSSYVDMMKMVDSLLNSDEVFVMGEGGECVRQFFYITENTSNFNNYTTPVDSVRLMLKPKLHSILDSYQSFLIKKIKSVYDKFSPEYFVDFYRNHRIPGNFSLRTLILNSLTDKFTPFFDNNFINYTYESNLENYRESTLHKKIISNKNKELLNFFNKEDYSEDDDCQLWETRFPLFAKKFTDIVKSFKEDEFGISAKGLLDLIEKNKINPDRSLYLVLRAITLVSFINLLDDQEYYQKILPENKLVNLSF